MLVDHWLGRLHEWVWEREPTAALHKRLVHAARHVACVVRDLVEGQLSLRAMSLVYTTLLSLVPLLALAFSLLKALGVHNALEPALLEILRPLGEQAEEIVSNIVGFVENIKVGVLGALGVGLLLYAALSLVQKLESSFNWIWRIERSRGLGARFSEYLAVLIIGPTVVFLALGMTATVLNSQVVERLAQIQPMGWAIYLLTKLIPYALIVGVFTFLYAFIPSTRVKLKAAFVGALLAGVLWQSASLAFATFVANAVNYSLVYSGFAILIFLLIWLYVGWLILLLGAQLAFYVHHPEHLTPLRLAPYLPGRTAEMLGLAAVAQIGRRFLKAEPALTRDALARELNATPEYIDRVLDILVHHGVLARAGDDLLIPGRDLGAVTVAELWQVIRGGFGSRERSGSRRAALQEVEALVGDAEQSFAQGAGQVTVRDWLLRDKDR